MYEKLDDNNKDVMTLPVIVCWELWKTRNGAMFDDKFLSLWDKYGKILASFEGRRCIGKKSQTVNHSPPTFIIDCYRELFDRASQKDDTYGGVKVFIWLNDSNFYNIALNCGSCNNTRLYVTALWTLAHCAKELGLKDLRVLGDSRVVIDWIKEKYNIKVLMLNNWLTKINTVRGSFSRITLSVLIIQLCG